MNETWLRKNLILILITLAFYLPTGLIANYCLQLIESNRCYARLYRQRVACDVVKRAGEVPETIGGLFAMCHPETFPEPSHKYIDYYDANAWKHSGRVFLMHKYASLYYVTFGDGSQAILKYWTIPDAEKIRRGRPLTRLYIRPEWSHHWIRLVVFGAIGVIFTLLITALLPTIGRPKLLTE